MTRFRVLSIFLTMLMLFTFVQFFTVGSSAEESPITLTVGSVECERGDDITIPVRLTGNTHLNGIQFRVIFDPTMLEVSQTASTLERFSDNRAVSSGENYIEFIGTSLTTYTGNGTLANVRLKAIKAGQSALTVEVIEAYYVNRDYEMVDLPCTTVPGTVDTSFNSSTDFYYWLDAPATPLNQQATIYVYMSNVPTIYGFSLNVNFDPEKVEFVSGETSDIFPWGAAVCKEAGKVRVFGATEINAPAGGDGEDVLAATLVFNVIDPDKHVGSTYDFSISFYNNEPAYTLDEDNHTVKITDVYTDGTTLRLKAHVHTYGEPTFVWDGWTASASRVCSYCGNAEQLEVTVTDEVTVPPSATQTGIKTYTASVTVDGNVYTDTKTEVLPVVETYDLNGDGSTNIRDVTLLLNVLSGFSDGLAAGVSTDLNGSGLTDIADVTALLNHLAG